ncbi:MAG: hypothetical protein KC463_07370 [Streptococcus sp.]|nr:hypothetical protein [Streptococcus sp.]
MKINKPDIAIITMTMRPIGRTAGVLTVVTNFKMNRKVIISTLIVLTSCSQSNQTESLEQSEKQTITNTKVETTKTTHVTEKVNCTDFAYNSAEQQADSLLAFMEKSQNSSSENQIMWEQKLFCSFPNSFNEMQVVFGYNDKNGAAPLYDYPKGENVIQYFSQLESIPDSIYYDKFVRINIDGIWEADNIREAFGFANKLLKDTKNACEVLSTFSDKQIISVFRFIFDGPHPKNEMNEWTYKKLKQKINSQNERLSRLLTESYEELMAEDDGHGH